MNHSTCLVTFDGQCLEAFECYAESWAAASRWWIYSAPSHGWCSTPCFGWARHGLSAMAFAIALQGCSHTPLT